MLTQAEMLEYERTIKELEPHIERQEDGTFFLNHDGTGFDPFIFSDLSRSVEQTNYMIREGILKPEDVVE